MSNFKLMVGHSLADGSGRDTYVSSRPLLPAHPVFDCGLDCDKSVSDQIKCRPDSTAFVKPLKKLHMGPKWSRTKRARFAQLHASRSRDRCLLSQDKQGFCFDWGCFVSLYRRQAVLPMNTATGEILISYSSRKQARYASVHSYARTNIAWQRRARSWLSLTSVHVVVHVPCAVFGRPQTDYKMVFVPETEPSRAYIPMAKSYVENKAMADSNQKHGDVARFTLRRGDVLRREAAESERVRVLTQSIVLETLSTHKTFFCDSPLLCVMCVRVLVCVRVCACVCVTSAHAFVLGVSAADE